MRHCSLNCWLSLPLVLLGTSCSSEESVRVFAAASTAEVVRQSLREWSRDSQELVSVSAGATSLLVRQVQAGASPDLVVAAHPQWIEELDGIERWDWLGNSLVEFRLRAGDSGGDPGCIAVGDPDHVPVGMYFKTAAEAQGRWDVIQTRIVPMADAPASVVAVRAGICPRGVAYRTDVLGQSDLVVTTAWDPVPPIRIPVVVRTERGRAAANWLRSEAGVASALAAGFRGVP